jgi:hypothetical protein
VFNRPKIGIKFDPEQILTRYVFKLCGFVSNGLRQTAEETKEHVFAGFYGTGR